MTGTRTAARLAPLLDHRLPLHGDEWAIWRTIALRGAGFPAATILDFADDECAAAADRLLEAPARLAAARERALGAIDEALDELRGSGAWETRLEERKVLLRARKALRKNRLPKPREESLRNLVGHLMTVHEQETAAREAYERAYLSADERQARAIHEAARDPRFQEALLWQNRRAFHTAVRKVAEAPPETLARNSRRRQNEELVAMYWQRYATKNDTIGFFGPVGWGRFVEEGGIVSARPGRELNAARTVTLEAWCVEEVAAALAAREGVRLELRPERLPHVEIRDGACHVPLEGQLPLPPLAVALLELCDGQRPAREIVGRLRGEDLPGLDDEASSWELLAQLHEQGLIEWGFHLPPSPRAFEALLEQIRQIDDPGAQAWCLSRVQEIEEARRETAEAAGDVPRLDRALDRLNETFTRITGESPTRRAGQSYAARTLLYEDCRRDFELEIGPRFRAQIGPPLSLLLMSARWFSFETARAFRRLARHHYDELSTGEGAPVPALEFWARLSPLLDPSQRDQYVAPVWKELQRRWSDILRIDPKRRRVTLRSEDLRARVKEAFDAPGPGWQQALYHSPDLMIASPSLEAFARGDYQIVLGEIHVAFNTLDTWLFASQHPDPERLVSEMAADVPWVSVKISEAKAAVTATRVLMLPAREPYFVIPPLDHVYEIPESQRLPANELMVVDTPDGLVLRTEDDRLCLDVAEAVGELLSFNIYGLFGFAEENAHWPRITLDRMVIARESWLLAAASLSSVAACGDRAQRFLEVRRWAREHRLPRFVFVKVACENKPFYVDFDAPVYVEHLLRSVRRTLDSTEENKALKITEMLPDPNQLWLPDAQGRRYTSELRLVVADRAHVGQEPERSSP